MNDAKMHSGKGRMKLWLVERLLAAVGCIGWWTIQVLLVWPFAAGRWVRRRIEP
jgi:hypothetical protein